MSRDCPAGGSTDVDRIVEGLSVVDGPVTDLVTVARGLRLVGAILTFAVRGPRTVVQQPRGYDDTGQPPM
jgi:hypothetical protein